MIRILPYIIFLLFVEPAISQIKVACIGNSITFGARISNRETNAYPQQLNRILGENWEVKNFGSNGATMLKRGDKPYWELKIYQETMEFQPDVVIIKLGTNDSKPHNWDNYKNEFKADYKDMIKTFQELESKPFVYLGLPVPVVKDKFTILKITVEQTITTIIKQIAHEENLEIIDFYTILKDREELLPDWVHPNAKGAKLMAVEAASVLKANKETIVNR